MHRSGEELLPFHQAMNQREPYAPVAIRPAMSGQTPATVDHPAASALQAEAHARALADTYGMKVAHEIARTNAEFTAGKDYWRNVLVALSTVSLIP